MTNAEALAQLRETAGAGEASQMVRAGLAVLIAQGATPEELMNLCGSVLEVYADQLYDREHDGTIH